jgi:hypothetical protein
MVVDAWRSLRKEPLRKEPLRRFRRRLQELERALYDLSAMPRWRQ